MDAATTGASTNEVLVRAVGPLLESHRTTLADGTLAAASVPVFTEQDRVTVTLTDRTADRLSPAGLSPNASMSAATSTGIHHRMRERS
jgi:hypothetical protein